MKLFTKVLFAILAIVILTTSLHSQSGSINNTLGTGGSFTIKDNSDTLFSLNQTNDFLSLKKLRIFKGINRFIHDSQGIGTDGFNTFLGVNAGSFSLSGANEEASYNTATGNSALNALSSGRGNSAFGALSLLYNTEGFWNSAFGCHSLLYNTTGHSNCTFGTQSLFSNTSGFRNNAFGLEALTSNTEGNYNCALGHQSLFTNTIGNNNSAFGHASLRISTGSYNTAVGSNGGFTLSSGDNNTFIGYNAQPSASTVSNEITLGNGLIQTLRCQVTTITSLSDVRDKKNIKDLPLGIDFLMSIKPRLFNWDRRDWYDNGEPDGSKMQQNPTAGFIAQELNESQAKANAEWLNLVLKSNPERLEATPGNLLPIMVKAIQELKAENDVLRNELSSLRQSIAVQVEKEIREVLLRAKVQDETTIRLQQTLNVTPE